MATFLCFIMQKDFLLVICEIEVLKIIYSRLLALSALRALLYNKTVIKVDM